MYNKFDGVYKPTTKSREYHKLEVEGEQYNLMINDIFGYDKVNAWMADLIRRCDGFVLVFSLSKAESFESLTRIIGMIQSIKNKSASELPIVVVGNKKDTEYVKVSSVQIDDFKKKNHVEVIQVSALTGENVDSVFEKLVQKHNYCKAKALHDNQKKINEGYKCNIF